MRRQNHTQNGSNLFLFLFLFTTLSVLRVLHPALYLFLRIFMTVSSPLSTDTAIINHRKEYSRSRLHTAVGRLPACLPVLHSWTSDSNRDFTPIQEHHAQKSKPGWLQHTSSFCPHRSSPNLSNQLARTWWPGSKPTVMSGWQLGADQSSPYQIQNRAYSSLSQEFKTKRPKCPGFDSNWQV